jgi:hypothetical protein
VAAVLGDTFENALALLGRGRAIEVRGRAEDDDYIEASLRGVAGWDGAVCGAYQGGIDAAGTDDDGDEPLRPA